jgi:starvation-inducible outer membrane lipoprotein
MKRKTKRILLIVGIVATLAFALTACQTQPKMPDPFDAALEAAIVKMFDTQGQPKP